jgi:NADPH-dependent 2,4-dienoyl-CoA reductase/sulfur reductase-like enzyme
MHVAIIGNGIAGVTAARWLRKLDDAVQITIISAETEFHFSRTALMYEYMGHMRWEDLMPYETFFWPKNRIDLVKKYVERIHASDNKLEFADGTTMMYDHLVIACGSQWNKFGWPGQDLKRVGGMVSAQDLQYLTEVTPEIKTAVVVGGGLIGIELAEMLHSRQIPVSLLIREGSYWSNALPPEESRMVSRQIRSHGIDLQENTELDTIHDDGTGAAGSITTKDGATIECQYVGLTAGVSPNISFLKSEESIELGQGVKVDNNLRTSVSNIWAIGDCAEARSPREGRRAIEAIWYTGRMMGETVAYNILGKAVEYDPGIWFNSAKFLDLEYQVYGEVPTHGRAGLATLYWEHEDGEHAVRINYEASTGLVRGFNLMGIRYRQEVCEKWIATETHIEEVLTHLGLANFDPEFYKQYEQAVVDLYNQQTGKKLELKTKRGLSAAIKFLRRAIAT